MCTDKKEEKEEEGKKEMEELEMEETDEPRRPSPLSRMLTSFRERVWPKIQVVFTFTVTRESWLGIFLHLFGCVMAYLSAFTITYQVHTVYVHMVYVYSGTSE